MWYIFCAECTDLSNNTRQDVDIDTPQKFLTEENRNLVQVINKFEKGLTPHQPAKSKIEPRIIGQGSTSIGFFIDGWEHLLIRRFPGFYTFEDAKKHLVLINKYRTKLHKLKVQTTITQLIALEDRNGYGVVYVIQPYLTEKQLSKRMTSIYGSRFKQQLLQKQATIAKYIIDHNLNHPESAITVDIVNNNWEISNFNPGTMDFDVKLNDLAQPLFKEDGKLTYDFYDQAASIVFPLNWIAQTQMKYEFGELFHPRKLMMQALWGYDEAASYLYSAYLWLTGGIIYRDYPQWAMDTVNNVLESYGVQTISSYEALEAHYQDKSALACLRLYRQSTMSFRSMFRLPSNVYMNPGSTPVEMYDSNKTPGYYSCLMDSIK